MQLCTSDAKQYRMHNSSKGNSKALAVLLGISMLIFIVLLHVQASCA